MIVEVKGSIEGALLLLKRRLEKDRIFQFIRTRDIYPKQSERRKAKDRRAAMRRTREERKQWSKEARGR